MIYFTIAETHSGNDNANFKEIYEILKENLPRSILTKIIFKITPSLFG